MAGPCGCKGAGCGCCFIENPSSGVPYSVFGSGESGDCVSIDIENIVTTLVDNGDGTLTYTNELGNSVTFFDGEHYSVDVIGELEADEPVPNVVAGTCTAFGPATPLAVTRVNPSTVHPMSVHTVGTGEEVLMIGGQTASNNERVEVDCRYSLNGAPAVHTKFGGGQVALPLRSANQYFFNDHTAPPVFTASVPAGGSWFITLSSRRYALTALLNAGSLTVQGQKIAVSGSTTV